MHFEKSHRANTAIAVKLYNDISEPASQVPISEVLKALPAREQADFEERFTDALRAGLFDGMALKFLSEGEWIDLDSKVFARIEAAFDAQIVRDVYLQKAALPRDTLVSWARKFEIALPSRFAEGEQDKLVWERRIAGSNLPVARSQVAEVFASISCSAEESSCSSEPSAPIVRASPPPLAQTREIRSRGGPNPVYDHGAILAEVRKFYQKVGDAGFASRPLQVHLRKCFPKPSPQQLRNICRPLIEEVKAVRSAKKNSSIKSLVMRLTAAA